MSAPRDVRRCALQALYQFDVGNADDLNIVRESLEGAPGDEKTHERGLELAQEAWGMREAADAAFAPLTPEWPVYRQPIIDRSLLRLAYFEMMSRRTPPKVMINEAIELAREYSTEKSPMFINGVLDKLYRLHREALRDDVSAESTESAEA
ncbi:MAG: transcription antitermination factor NusB [Phycisphaerales bacterium]|nr:transcription antitermination factor NusB [Phycisphaerales bacterium]